MSRKTIAGSIANAKPGRIRILIIGAGVVGLTLAALMCQRGEAPVVIERDKTFANNKGYMLGLYPIGSRVLHGLGLHEEFVSNSVPMRQYNIGVLPATAFASEIAGSALLSKTRRSRSCAASTERTSTTSSRLFLMFGSSPSTKESRQDRPVADRDLPHRDLPHVQITR